MTLPQTIIFAGSTSSVRFTQYGGAASFPSAAAVARVYLLATAAALGFDRKNEVDDAQHVTLHYPRCLFFSLSVCPFLFSFLFFPTSYRARAHIGSIFPLARHQTTDDFPRGEDNTTLSNKGIKTRKFHKSPLHSAAFVRTPVRPGTYARI